MSMRARWSRPEKDRRAIGDPRNALDVCVEQRLDQGAVAGDRDLGVLLDPRPALLHDDSTPVGDDEEGAVRVAVAGGSGDEHRLLGGKPPAGPKVRGQLVGAL